MRGATDAVWNAYPTHLSANLAGVRLHCHVANRRGGLPDVREYGRMEDAREVVERCLIHWLPDLAPSRGRDMAVSIVGNLVAAGADFGNTHADPR